MNVEQLLTRGGGVVTWRDLGGAFGAAGRQRVVTSGRLVRLLPQVYVPPELVDDPLTVRRAAVAYAGGRGALSHGSGLAVHGMPGWEGRATHLAVARSVRLRGTTRFLVHRRAGFDLSGPRVVRRQGLPVLALEECLIDMWGSGQGDDQRAPFITAARERRTTPHRVRAALRGRPVPDRGGLIRLAELLETGCDSELEIWGYLHVFLGSGMPELVRQYRVVADGVAHYLDLAHLPSMVALELDGASSHSPHGSRERDTRRDARLAKLGWLTVRFTTRRLRGEPETVRREAGEVIARRLDQFGDQTGRALRLGTAA
ncbi:MAG: DUF559 domain-containing protein [Streptosporangiaceae bacterium]